MFAQKSVSADDSMDRRSRNLCWVFCTSIFLLICGIAFSDAENEPANKELAKNESWEGGGKWLTGRAASELAGRFREVGAAELGGATLAKVLASLHPSTRVVSDEDLAFAISERLSNKMTTASQILLEMKKNIMNDSNLQSFTYPCPLNSYKKTHHFRDIQIKSDKVTLNIPKSNFKLYIKNAVKKYNLKVKRQYFMSVRDAATDPVCTLRSSSRQLFHQQLQPAAKVVLLLPDPRLGPQLLRLASPLLRALLELLGPADRVGLLLPAGSVAPLHADAACHSAPAPTAGPATRTNRHLLLQHLASMEHASNKANFSTANITESLQTLLKALEPSEVSQNISIIYLGKISYIHPEIGELSRLLHKSQTESANKYIVTGCHIHIPGESQKAEHDEVETNIQEGMWFSGKWIVAYNSSVTAGQVASWILLRQALEPPLNSGLAVGSPVLETLQKDLLVPFMMPVHPLGLLVLDLYLTDITEDIVYFNSFSKKHRAFIIDFSGNVIAHSMYPRPEVVPTEPRLIDISNLERGEQFELAKQNMLLHSSGTFRAALEQGSVKYTWRWAQQLLVVCVVRAGERGAPGRLAGGAARELQHHRMDLLPPPHSALCRHFHQVASIHKGTLYLSPSSFQSPFQYLYDIKNGKDASLNLMQSYMAYLKDSTRLLSNPGLRAQIRNDVGILNPMLSYFKRQHIYGAYNKYIVRRYAATEHGVLVMFPGTIMESDLEPNRSPWFVRALRDPGKLILSPPRLDEGGAGYTITLSLAPSDTPSLEPSIVLSMDMTMGYLYKMLLDSLPLCMEPNVKCFIMDDGGYLLSHPGLLEPAGTGPVERQHVTHKESLMANDMLNHRGFVRKQLCKNYADGTIQRFYEFNTTLDTILTNIVHGEHCARYFISAIPGTNSFVGMVNSSCNLGAFCPCSVVDRLCLNCNRMEQSECECPCECALPEQAVCPAPAPAASAPAAPLCDLQPEKSSGKGHYLHSMASHLDSCFDFQCESYSSRSACLGVLGCQWCQLQRGGDAGLAAPFCAEQAACFGGVLGGPSPYGEGCLGQVGRDDLAPAYSAVGPTAGCIVALCLVLALAVYCYKQNLGVEPPPYPGLGAEEWHEDAVRMSHLREDETHDERASPREQLLLAADAAPVSPYRVLTGYRRPAPPGESDHGYSTMTPHEESEHQAFALAVPAPSPSLSTPRSSAADVPPDRTVLPCGKRSFVVPVTVHRHMEAT